jgi:DNA-binding Lrp family transcriptional regulator
MPKTSKKQIDEDDKKFLSILQNNSGDSIENIAEKCGFSKQKACRIEKRLKKNNIIWGYPPIINYSDMSLIHYIGLFKRSPVPFDKETIKEVTKGALEDRFQVDNIKIESVLFVHGEFDLIISFTAPNVVIMKKFCDKLMSVFSKYIDSYSIHETIVPVRKQGIKNPIIGKQDEFF